MKITKQQLKQIILEELQLLSEEEYDTYRDDQLVKYGSTGRSWSTRGEPFYRRKSREEYEQDQEYYRKETEKTEKDIERAIQDAIKGEQSAPPTAQPGKRWIQSATYEIAYEAGLQGVQDAKNGEPKDQDIMAKRKAQIDLGSNPNMLPKSVAYIQAYERTLAKLQEK